MRHLNQYILTQFHLEENTKHIIPFSRYSLYSKIIPKLKINENVNYFTQPHDEETLYGTEYNEVKYSTYR